MLARQFGRGGDDKERGTKGQRLSGSLDCSLLVAYRVFQKSFSVFTCGEAMQVNKSSFFFSFSFSSFSFSFSFSSLLNMNFRSKITIKVIIDDVHDLDGDQCDHL